MREHAPKHDHPIHPMGLHELIAKIAVNRMTGIDECLLDSDSVDITMGEVNKPQPVVLPRIRIIKRPDRRDK